MITQDEKDRIELIEKRVLSSQKSHLNNAVLRDMVFLLEIIKRERLDEDA